jgi:hypothetical protein
MVVLTNNIPRVSNINKKFEVIIKYNNEHSKNVAYQELYHLLEEYRLNKNNVQIIEIKIQNNWTLNYWTVSLR